MHRQANNKQMHWHGEKRGEANVTSDTLRHAYKEREIQTEIQTDRDGNRQRQRQTDRQRERERETHTHRNTQTTLTCVCLTFLAVAGPKHRNGCCVCAISSAWLAMHRQHRCPRLL